MKSNRLQHLAYVLVFLVGINPIVLNADVTTKPMFHNISIMDGLLSQTVPSIIQDSYGYMWFGTAEGLERYDGIQFHIFKNVPGDETSLSDSWINKLFLTSDGQFLVCTEAGLNVYHPETETFSFYEVSNDTEGFLKTMRIRSIFEDSRNDLWLGTSEGLIRIDRARNYLTYLKLLPAAENNMSNEVTAICEDNTGIIWVATFDGLFKLSPSDLSHTRFELSASPSMLKTNNYISSIYCSDSEPNTLYVGTSRGFCRFDTVKLEATFLKKADGNPFDDDIKCVTPLDSTNLMIGTVNGLVILDTTNDAFEIYAHSEKDESTISGNNILCTYKDDQGLVWISTSAGVSTFNTSRQGMDYLNLWSINDGMAPNHISDIDVMSNGEYWISSNTGIYVYDGEFRFLRKYTYGRDGLTHDMVLKLLQDSYGTIWAATNNGVNYFDEASNRFKNVESSRADIVLKYVYDLEEMDGKIVANVSSGICLINPQRDRRGKITDISLSVIRLNRLVSSDNTDIKCLRMDRNDHLWIGTMNDGLISFNYKTEELVKYQFETFNPESINSNHIYTLFVDRDDHVWAGTDRGLCQLDPSTGRFVRYSDDIDLSEPVRNITEDANGRLWICSLHKVIMFDRERDVKVVNDIYQDFYKDELSYNCCYTGNDRIFFSSGPGLVRVNTNEISERAGQRPVVISGLLSGDGTYYPTTTRKDLSLPHWIHSFELSFALLDYLSPTANKYLYRLQGFDGDWHQAGGLANKATYSAVPSGRYTFEVQGCNSDGSFTQESAALDIRIARPWWNSVAAIILYSLLLCAIILLIFKLTLSRLKLATELKMEKMDRIRMEELGKTKMKFFANISHEFKTPLSLILGTIETMEEGSSSNALSSKLQVMESNAKRMLRLVDQIMDLRKIDNEKITFQPALGDITLYAKKVFDAFVENAQRRNISYDFIDEGEVLCSFDPDKIEKVLFNLLSNAFKFTPDGAPIHMSVMKTGSRESGIVQISVTDAGIGMDKDELSKIFDRFYQGDTPAFEDISSSGIGLNLAKEFVELHGGTLSVESEKGKGSTFTIFLPYERRLTDSTVTDDSPAAEDNKKKIVVVDDNQDMLSFIKNVLIDTYRIYNSSSPSRALKMIEDLAPDVVITDVMMPEMNGFELCRRIKSAPLTSHIPVIILTAKGRSESEEEGYRSGGDAFITKPFTVKLLRSRIANLIDSRESLKSVYRQKFMMEPSLMEVENEDDKFIKSILTIIEENIDNEGFSVQDICNKIPYSYLQIYRKIKALTGVTVSDLVRTVRLKRAAQYLSDSGLRISEVMYNVGFSSHSYFTKCFRDYYGVTPSEYVTLHRKEK